MNAMKRRRKVHVRPAVWPALLGMLLVSASYAHDPLREDGEHDHDLAPNVVLDARPDLDRVRALVLSFRETGDDRYLGQAWTLLMPALGGATNDPEVLIAAAFIAQSLHQFDYAVRLVSNALEIEPNADQSWLLLASIQLVLGEVEAAATACRQLRNVSPLVLLTCKARVALASGNALAAFARLQGVLQLPDSQRLPPDVLAWSYSVAGDLAVAAEKSPPALALYRHSLALAERTQVRAALVDVLLNEARFEDAWLALDAGAPALPLLLRRLITARKLGRLHEMQAELDKVEREFADWIANEDWLHAREMTRFYLDVVARPDLARRLALINVGLQREPEDLLLETRTRLPAT